MRKRSCKVTLPVKNKTVRKVLVHPRFRVAVRKLKKTKLKSKLKAQRPRVRSRVRRVRKSDPKNRIKRLIKKFVLDRKLVKKPLPKSRMVHLRRSLQDLMRIKSEYFLPFAISSARSTKPLLTLRVLDRIYKDRY